MIQIGMIVTTQAYRKEFWTVERKDGTINIRNVHLQDDMNNNKMERLNGEFRDSEKVVRGMKKDESPIIDDSIMP